MSKGPYNGYSNVIAEKMDQIDIAFIDDISRGSPKPGPADGCEEYREFPVFYEVRKVIKLLKIFRCRYSKDSSKLSLFVNYIIMMFVVLSLAFISGVIIASVSRYSLDNRALPTSLMRFTFYVQGISSILFIFYWQRRSPTLTYAQILHSVQNSAGCIQNRHRLSRLVILLYCCLGFILVFLFCSHSIILLEYDVEIYDPKMMETFRKHKSIAFLSFFLNCYASFCVAIGFFLYSIFTYAGVLEVDHYNRRLQKIGESKDKVLVEELICLINDHAKLSDAIRTLDSFCGVYAFIMIGCTVPTTIFSLLQLLLSADLPLINLLITLPLLGICVLQLSSLTAIPAMLHNSLEQSKHFFYSNITVWKTFDNRVYQIANSLASHLNQSDLGISVWGFAVVSKPLILTTISVMVTCIAFFLELRRRPHIPG